MKVPREWNDEGEMMEMMFDALEAATLNSDALANAFWNVTSEGGEYGERGTVTISLPDGRKFRLDLAEIV